MDIIGKRYLYFGLSLLVIIPGLIALALWGLPLAIDFTGGSVMEVQFTAGTAPEPAKIISLVNNLGIKDVQVQSSGDIRIIRTSEIQEETKNKVVAELQKAFDSKMTLQSFSSVGPVIGKEVASKATLAVTASALGILLYIWFAFRGVQHAFRYGVAAVTAMLHDVLVVIGVAAIMGHFFKWEIDSLFLTALLTVIGFSVHDTIVVFDRIRENAGIYRRLEYEKVVNHSIIQTMTRSINTQLTVMLCLLALALLGGVTTRHFVITLLIGVFSGTYSSVFNAAPILVVWENREWNTWFKGKSNDINSASAA
jgi:preprotein translocase subunit SecF